MVLRMSSSVGRLLYAVLAPHVHASWMYQLGTPNWDSAQGLAVEDGIIYVAGETEGLLENARFGGSDLFVAKLNSSGEPIWIRQRGSTLQDRVGDIKVNSSGHVIVVGFAEAPLDGQPLAGGDDVFVSAFDGDGVWLWTRMRGTFYEDHAASVLLTDTGDIIVAGDTAGGLDGNTNAGYADIFLMKFTGAGEWLWTRQRGSSAGDVVAAMRMMGDSLVLAGHTGGSLDGHVNAGGLDMFVMKLDSTGSWLWTRQRGSTFEEHATALIINSGRIFVFGDTKGSLDGNTNLGFADVFLMEFDSEGNWQWTLQRGSAADDFATCAQPFGSGFAVGGFTLGALDGNSNAGDEDLFVMEFDQNASWLRTLQWGTLGRDFTSAMAIIDPDDLLIAGRTSGSFIGYRRAGVSDAFVVTVSALNSSLPATQATSHALVVPKGMLPLLLSLLLCAGCWE